MNKKYLTVHSDATRREKWSKVNYEVTISDGGCMYKCECGLAEHVGMLCCHSIRVMLRQGVDKIPEGHILKRWTKDATDVLPDHLVHLQKDRGSARSQSYRHATLHVAALELAAIGDKNVDCYHYVLKYMKDGTKKFGEMYQYTDGRSLHELLVAPVVNLQVPQASDVVPRQIHTGVLAPVRKCPEGRPTNTRDKPAYELKRKRMKFRTVCKLSGHNRSECKANQDKPASKRSDPKCGKCVLVGHRMNVCASSVDVQHIEYQLGV